MTNSKYTQGQRVYFDLGENKPKGWATIEGHQGFVIIVKPEEPISNYDFTHIYIIDTQIVAEPTA